MNFHPPTDWLQGPPKAPADAQSERLATPSAHFRGQLPPRRGPPLLAEPLQLGAPLPSCKVELRLRPFGPAPVKVVFCLADFTQHAVALAHLRFADSARRGWLLEEEREAQDMLDDQDPAALHLVGHHAGQLLLALRLVMPGPGEPFAWQQLACGQHATELAALAPAGEFSRLAVAQGMDAPRLLRGLVQAASYVLLASGRRYAFVAAAPGHAELWRRFGLHATGLGGYVPSAKPHVVEILLGDLLGQYQGHNTNLRTWRNLFSGTHKAVAQIQRMAAPAGVAGWPLAVYRSLSVVLSKLNSRPFAT